MEMWGVEIDDWSDSVELVPHFYLDLNQSLYGHGCLICTGLGKLGDAAA